VWSNRFFDGYVSFEASDKSDQGPILWNSVSVEKFSDNVLAWYNRQHSYRNWFSRKWKKNFFSMVHYKCEYLKSNYLEYLFNVLSVNFGRNWFIKSTPVAKAEQPQDGGLKDRQLSGQQRCQVRGADQMKQRSIHFFLNDIPTIVYKSFTFC
jgi:hypothetical protein